MVRDQEVDGSNPFAPTTNSLGYVDYLPVSYKLKKRILKFESMPRVNKRKLVLHRKL